MQLYLKIASGMFLEIEKFKQYHCLIISPYLKYSLHYGNHDISNCPFKKTHNYLRRGKEEEWHKIGFGEVKTIIKP